MDRHRRLEIKLEKQQMQETVLKTPRSADPTLVGIEA